MIRRAGDRRPGAYVCLTNVHTTTESRRSPELRRAAEGAYLSVPDGMPLVWILRRRGHARTEKVTGIEFVPAVVAAGVDAGLRHALYGGGPGVAERAARRLERLVPGARVVGMEAPRIDLGRLDGAEVSATIRDARPDVLWVGLGAPKQEVWMSRLAGSVDVPVMVGVGAAFDYLAGSKPAAPAPLRHVGLEWAFRLAVEPRRLWRRYLVTNSTFVWLLVRERLASVRKRFASARSGTRPGDARRKG